jgi:hypothetical protein
MERVTRLAAAPRNLVAHDDGSFVLDLEDGLYVCREGRLEALCDRIDGLARGPDGGLYCTRGQQILRIDLDGDGAEEDLTAAFGGAPQGRSQVICTPDGEIWVEGSAHCRHPNSTFSRTPACPLPHPGPVPHATDIYGNRWGLVDGSDANDAGAMQVVVLPANAPDAWQPAWLPAGRWEFLFADSVGFVWVTGADGWRVFCPRRAAAGWRVPAEGLPAGKVTAMGASPDERVMAAFDTGQLLELDTNEAGDVLVRSLATVSGTARCVHVDENGAIWVATETGLYRQQAEANAWQRTWCRQRGRLPGGGNHDVFATSCQGKLYVAGGWAGAWGLPPGAHVCDELFCFDPESQYWEVASRMHIPRRYNGIAEMDGRVWVVGGETRTPGREGDGQALYLVDIYDPASDTWRAGPALNDVRTDPFVVSCNGRIYAIGGASHNSGPKLDTVESIGSGEGAWRFETPLPEPTRQGHACALDGIIYCASIDGVYAFDTVSSRWDPDLPQPGSIGQGPLSAAYQGEVWLIGGFGDQRCRCYDPRTRTWRAGPDLPTEQAWGAAIVLHGQLLVAGGAHASPTHDAVVFDDRSYILRQSPIE